MVPRVHTDDGDHQRVRVTHLQISALAQRQPADGLCFDGGEFGQFGLLSRIRAPSLSFCNDFTYSMISGDRCRKDVHISIFRVWNHVKSRL